MTSSPGRLVALCYPELPHHCYLHPLLPSAASKALFPLYTFQKMLLAIPIVENRGMQSESTLANKLQLSYSLFSFRWVLWRWRFQSGLSFSLSCIDLLFQLYTCLAHRMPQPFFYTPCVLNVFCAGTVRLGWGKPRCEFVAVSYSLVNISAWEDPAKCNSDSYLVPPSSVPPSHLK